MLSVYTRRGEHSINRCQPKTAGLQIPGTRRFGRAVHDGGALLGPLWPRYGNSPRWPVEVGQVFTLELEAEVPGVGYASLEEDVVVTPEGARWLSRPQYTPSLLGG